MTKATATLGGVTLSGNSTITWRFQTGTQPYVTTFTVPNSVWDRILKSQMGKPLALEITDSRGAYNAIQGVYILHAAPSGSPHRTTFVVADRRWLWEYTLIARDYNVTRKSGDRMILSNVPVPGGRVEDQYDYKPYSLRNGDTKWTAKEAVTDMLELLEGTSGPTGGKNYVIESFPIADSGSAGQFTLQNIVLRDQGDVALARLLSYIPAAEVYIDKEGKARVIDAADFLAMEQYFNNLPPTTWDGDKPQFIDRKKIRPARVAVHYQREVEAVFSFVEGDTITKNSPFLENVIPTVDPTMAVGQIRDPETGELHDNIVAMGTYVEFTQWLKAADEDKPTGSFPWTLKTIRQSWVEPPGNLADALSAVADKQTGEPKDDKVNFISRYLALKRHFRQTFRINPRYMDRIRDIAPYRVGVLDPVMGARAHAPVWGQACVRNTLKGQMLAARRNPDKGMVNVNIDSLPKDGAQLNDTASSPAQIVIIDRDQGIFRIEWVLSPYGTNASFIPSNLTLSSGTKAVVGRNLANQDNGPMGHSMTIEGRDTGLFLSAQAKMKVMLTIAPAAPNNKSQFYVETVEASDIKDTFRKEYRIQDGEGPTLEVFIPAAEVTARFAWDKDDEAEEGIKLLLGLNSDDPNTAGLPQDDPSTKKNESKLEAHGFIFVNGGAESGQHKRRHILDHARAVAAEVLSAYADNLQGQVATAMPGKGLALKGNMNGATLQVSSAPSAKVNAVHEFPGQAREISRMGFMSDGTRFFVLGIVRFGDER